MVIVVLLNVALICATPTVTLRRTLRRCVACCWDEVCGLGFATGVPRSLVILPTVVLKHEIRNPKLETNLKFQRAVVSARFGHFHFVLGICFVFRICRFGFL